MKPRGLLVKIGLPIVLILLAGYFGGLMLYGSQNWSLQQNNKIDPSAKVHDMQWAYWSILFAFQAINFSFDQTASLTGDFSKIALGAGIVAIGLGVIVFIVSCLPLFISKKGRFTGIGSTVSWIYSLIFLAFLIVMFWFSYSSLNQKTNSVTVAGHTVPISEGTGQDHDFIKPLEYGIWGVFGLTILMIILNVFYSIYSIKLSQYAKLTKKKLAEQPNQKTTKANSKKPVAASKAAPTTVANKSAANISQNQDSGKKPTISAATVGPLPRNSAQTNSLKPQANGVKTDYDRIWAATKSTRDDFVQQTERVKKDGQKKKATDQAKKTPEDKLKSKWSKESKKVYSK